MQSAFSQVEQESVARQVLLHLPGPRDLHLRVCMPRRTVTGVRNPLHIRMHGSRPRMPVPVIARPSWCGGLCNGGREA